MTAYYCNEAMIELPDVRSLVDLTRQSLQIVTEDGAEIELVVERARATDQTLKAVVEARIAERRRSVRGFELLSCTERRYPDVIGIEARLTLVDRQRGPRFVHELHCAMNATWFTYQGTSGLPHAARCDQWMQSVLQSIKLR